MPEPSSIVSILVVGALATKISRRKHKKCSTLSLF
ncbi:MAG: PEP-CTERM sorting domain-containing protein [Okeania sp. SIO2G4]|nr:PEP-CTERM sorting domain-containing protein [Okeania sp. SIO2G5]NEQ94694.1 PEP-CTERM sorting domain-containing protein [Okeania sp. SIO2G4]